MLTDQDMACMQEALSLATSVIGLTDPNPRVGCVLIDAQGRVAGRGATQEVGGPHAEVMALRDADAGGNSVRGGTAFVTLEPCAHHGRTPPCCDALISAGLRRVVVAIRDPFPRVSGAGMARMRAAGIEVVELEGPLSEAARDLNIGFMSRMERGRPWVRMKVAASLDGRTALPDGRSQWITGPQARADGHVWRKRSSVILTGIGTVLADNPRLDVRLTDTVLQPMRVVVDSGWRIPTDARLLDPPGQALLVAARPDPHRESELAARGVQTLVLPDGAGGVDLVALLTELGRRGANEVHVEAGATLNGRLLEAGVVDELLLYLAPLLIGPGRAIGSMAALHALHAGLRFRFHSLAQVGDDLRLLARRAPEAMPKRAG